MPGCSGSETDKELEGSAFAFMLSDPIGRLPGIE